MWRAISRALVSALAISLGASSVPGSGPVAILTTPNVAPYAEALDGLRAAMPGGSPLQVFNLEARAGKPGVPAALAAAQPGVIVAIGSEAAQALAAQHVPVPVICTMVLRSDVSTADADAACGAAMIPLDVPLEALAERLKEVFPGKTRLGILRNADRPEPSAAKLQAQAKQCGLSLRIAECNRAEDLLPAFLSLRGQVDFVWCLPYGSLYNSSTVPALLRASLTNRLPVIGFSASFVRAGAVMGVYPDFREIGAQTADAIQRVAARRAVSGSPKVFHVAVNQRVLRLLGLEAANLHKSNEDVIVFR